MVVFSGPSAFASFAYARRAPSSFGITREIKKMNHRIGIIGVATALLAVGWSQATMAQGNCGNIVFSGRHHVTASRTRGLRASTSRRARARTSRTSKRASPGLAAATFGGVQAARRHLRPAGHFHSGPRCTCANCGHSPTASCALSRGQELDVYLPPDRWEIVIPQDPTQTFAAAPAVTTIPLQEPTPQLPRTGSPLPLLALLGGLIAAFGAGARGLRRKLERAA